PVTYNVSVTNSDSPACTPTAFALQASTPAGWQKVLGLTSLTVAPGATMTTTLKVTSPAVPAGSYTIVGTATSAATLSGSAGMVYLVGASGNGGAGSFTDTFDRPDSAALDNGWVVPAGTLMVQAGQARNAANSTLNLAVQPALMGASQTAAASVSSTNNNLAPRFGV